MDVGAELRALLAAHNEVIQNPARGALIRAAVDQGEAVVSRCGALATWTPPESTGRSPKDTVIVRRPESEASIDWTSPNNRPLSPETFDMVFADVLQALARMPRVYVTDRLLGADPTYTLPVRTVTDRALTALFTDNMFRPWDAARLAQSCFRERPFTLLVLPYEKLDARRYAGRLRVSGRLGQTSTMLIGMDFDRRLGIVYGSAYGGSVKKLMFTVMNYMLPAEGILPLHCSANEGPTGDAALLLGLSGTGKTTLSADPGRALLGDDEHGWNERGVSNFENGCYAKLINLDPVKEPEIHNACFHCDAVENHGAIIENALLYPHGSFDLFDDRLTPNSRGSYPLRYLSNIKVSSMSGHPHTILFLTADAHGVIPPVARLTREQAMLWFLMGYTSKLAGTETGIIEPVSTFSRFFGAPFMPCQPDVYAHMLGQRVAEHGTQAYLINTGWTGGRCGTGSRIDLRLTRCMVEAALSGALADADCEPDLFFKVLVPRRCPGIEDARLLQPVHTWSDKHAFTTTAQGLAGEFAAHYAAAYGHAEIDTAVAAACPGR